ncbi:hypothetical protein AQI95_14930 [Streptomyces yokosukanensis]|uniref:Uncharacterized protein n=1 Tax=Streptomyces yokosukanensis TaxID=67386 RepID=A0A101P774_9ACTN|nr:hypothetical protein [Streptomyces yokosukanensis]KUN06186.1 hypothetical protein AQI95_14930 [Streptomyces yokosukanensis]
MTGIGIDIGTRYARIARIGDRGVPELAELPGAVPGEGLPVPDAAGTGREDALRAVYRAYRGRYGTPDDVVAVVGQRGRLEQARLVTAALTESHGDGRAPRVRALSTPQAVLALLRAAGTATRGRYVVCDLGAAAAEASVCVVTAGAVAVAATARHAPADGYGAALDAALLAEAGLAADEEGRRALAAARAEEGAAQRLDLALERAEDRPERWDATAVHRVAGRDITAGTVRSALRRLTAGLDLALSEALGDGSSGGAAPPGGGHGDDPDGALVAVGGTARFAPLARHPAAAGWRLAPLPGGTDPSLAAVFGAALVAAGRIDPADRYPYAVCVGAQRTVAGRLKDQELVISEAGHLEPGGDTVYAQRAGQRLRVAVGPAGAAVGRPVQVRVRDPERGVSAPVRTLALPVGTEDDRFHVGVRLAVDGTARLVLHPLDPGAPAEFPLGSLPSDLRTDPKGGPS